MLMGSGQLIDMLGEEWGWIHIFLGIMNVSHWFDECNKRNTNYCSLSKKLAPIASAFQRPPSFHLWLSLSNLFETKISERLLVEHSWDETQNPNSCPIHRNRSISMWSQFIDLKVKSADLWIEHEPRMLAALRKTPRNWAAAEQHTTLLVGRCVTKHTRPLR